jgi:hypothetical protein
MIAVMCYAVKISEQRCTQVHNKSTFVAGRACAITETAVPLSGKRDSDNASEQKFFASRIFRARPIWPVQSIFLTRSIRKDLFEK